MVLLGFHQNCHEVGNGLETKVQEGSMIAQGPTAGQQHSSDGAPSPTVRSSDCLGPHASL